MRKRSIFTTSLTFDTTSTTPYLENPFPLPPTNHPCSLTMDNDPTKYNLKIMRISQKKNTNASVYRSHLLKILNSFPDATLCFTDDSKIGNRTGFAYLKQ